MANLQHVTLKSLERVRQKNDYLKSQNTMSIPDAAIDRAEKFVNDNPDLPYKTFAALEILGSVVICYGNTRMRFLADGWEIEDC
jgi:hypothetical protein